MVSRFIRAVSMSVVTRLRTVCSVARWGFLLVGETQRELANPRSQGERDDEKRWWLVRIALHQAFLDQFRDLPLACSSGRVELAIQFFFHRVAALLHAYSALHLAVTPLRLACPSPRYQSASAASFAEHDRQL